MRPSCFRRSLFIAAVCAMNWAAAHAAEPVPAPFYDLAFEAAGQRAAAEQKVLFVDFYTTWCGPCKMLDQSTWQDVTVIDLLRTKAVAIKIDAEKEKTLADHYKVSAYPTLLLLKPDGTEIDRLVGYREPKIFVAEFTDSLAGKTALVQAREAVASAASDHGRVQARFNLGRILARTGNDEEALAEFLWCYDTGMTPSSGFQGVRDSFLLSDIAHLGRHFPPARAALRERRDKALADAKAPDAAFGTLMDLVALNQALKKDSKTLAFLDQLPVDDPRRKSLDLVLFSQLLAAKRYADAAKGQPYSEMKRSFVMSQQVESRFDPSRRQMFHDYQVRWLAEHIEVLAGSGQIAEAKELLTLALTYDHSDEAKVMIRQHLERAGHTELLDSPAGVKG
ncbi:MAG TPA: thioredoxin family protein [Opitutaceae bacterium]|jgi:thiol-disulfide isomerase/thioredoxin|nr:thioredoxin family protein [Opitutaceae bacterium]